LSRDGDGLEEFVGEAKGEGAMDELGRAKGGKALELGREGISVDAEAGDDVDAEGEAELAGAETKDAEISRKGGGPRLADPDANMEELQNRPGKGYPNIPGNTPRETTGRNGPEKEPLARLCGNSPFHSFLASASIIPLLLPGM
jgi:hypothetical protein